MKNTDVSKAKKDGWLGFDGRIFLTEQEHETYCRRLPVRYAAKNLTNHENLCAKCGKPATLQNPLQVAHKIPFGLGVIRFRLTPEWLDGAHNLVWAHRQKCNKECEIPSDHIEEYLRREYGINLLP